MEAPQALRDEINWAMRAALIANPKYYERIRSRALTYPLRLNRDYLCPKCWMHKNVAHTMRAVPGTDEYDVLRCNSRDCEAEVVIPL